MHNKDAKIRDNIITHVKFLFRSLIFVILRITQNSNMKKQKQVVVHSRVNAYNRCCQHASTQHFINLIHPSKLKTNSIARTQQSKPKT